MMLWKLQENVIEESDIDLLIDFIREAKRFTQFIKVKELEKAYSAWQGCKYSVFVNSGSSANLILINALKELLGWQDNEEVLVPSVTWPTTVTPIIQCGLKPVFVDANLTDLSFDYGQVEEKITSRTVCIFVTHLLGFPADVPRLKEIVKGKNIVIIEDCCESHGAVLEGHNVGTLGLAGTFSFYWGHHMTTVEGGMLCTDCEDLFNLSVLKRSHGLARELEPMYHSEIKAKYPDIDFRFLFLTDGFNLRNTEFNAVLGLSQLNKLDKFIQIRNLNHARFVRMCELYPNELITLKSEGIASFALPFLFLDRDKKEGFEKMIWAEGIESRPLISGNLLMQPFLRHYDAPGEYPNAKFLHTNAFYIGNNQFVNDERLDFLDDLMAKFFSCRNKCIRMGI